MGCGVPSRGSLTYSSPQVGGDFAFTDSDLSLTFPEGGDAAGPDLGSFMPTVETGFARFRLGQMSLGLGVPAAVLSPGKCWLLCRGRTQICSFATSGGLTELADPQAPPTALLGVLVTPPQLQHRGSRADPGFGDTTGFMSQTSLSLGFPPRNGVDLFC